MLAVDEAMDAYYKEHVAVKVIDRMRIEYAMMPLREFFGDTPLRHVDIPMCREYRDFREDIKPSTVRKELSVVSAAAQHALKWRKIGVDEMPTIEMPALDAPRRVWLLKEELATLLETASTLDRRVFRFVQLAYHTASRKRAIEALTWPQVDLDSKRIDLQGSAPATYKRKPIVPISETMAQELATMRSKSTTDYVLAHDGDIRSAFDAVCTAAGLSLLPQQGLRQTGRLTPHVLRHSRATHLLQAGKEPWLVANLLGDNLQTVLKTYGHSCSNYLQGVLD